MKKRNPVSLKSQFLTSEKVYPYYNYNYYLLLILLLLLAFFFIIIVVVIQGNIKCQIFMKADKRKKKQYKVDTQHFSKYCYDKFLQQLKIQN